VALDLPSRERTRKSFHGPCCVSESEGHTRQSFCCGINRTKFQHQGELLFGNGLLKENRINTRAYDVGWYLDGTTEGVSVLNGEGAVSGNPHHEIQEL
jgi:hypothetical protein